MRNIDPSIKALKRFLLIDGVCLAFLFGPMALYLIAEDLGFVPPEYRWLGFVALIAGFAAGWRWWGYTRHGLPARTVSLEEQLRTLELCGIHLNPGVTPADLTASQDVRTMERHPYGPLIEVLSNDLEREPHSPITNALWMCDCECIEEEGAYRAILQRLELLTGGALGLTDISDHVDFDTKLAWVAFTYRGSQMRWNLMVDSDWMDTEVIRAYCALLDEARSSRRIYANEHEYGQATLFGCFSPDGFERYRSIAQVELKPF